MMSIAEARACQQRVVFFLGTRPDYLSRSMVERASQLLDVIRKTCYVSRLQQESLVAIAAGAEQHATERP